MLGECKHAQSTNLHKKTWKNIKKQKKLGGVVPQLGGYLPPAGGGCKNITVSNINAME